MPGGREAALAAALRSGVERLGLELESGAEERLLEYLYLLARWNRVYNLTAVRDLREMVTRHLLDCLAVAPWLHGERLLDVGSGAGLPGLVLAIARPGLACVLLDASAKRTRFCVQASGELGLERVRIEHARVEDYVPGQAFSTVISRAFTDAVALVRLSRPLLAPGGRVLAMKGRRPDAEIAALGALGGELAVRRLEVPGLDAERHLLSWQAPSRTAPGAR